MSGLPPVATELRTSRIGSFVPKPAVLAWTAPLEVGRSFIWGAASIFYGRDHDGEIADG